MLVIYFSVIETSINWHVSINVICLILCLKIIVVFNTHHYLTKMSHTFKLNKCFILICHFSLFNVINGR